MQTENVPIQDRLIRESDDDLLRIEEMVKTRIDRNRDRNFRVELETDLCFVQREIQLREKRKELHAAYLAASRGYGRDRR